MSTEKSKVDQDDININANGPILQTAGVQTLRRRAADVFMITETAADVFMITETIVPTAAPEADVAEITEPLRQPRQ